MQSNFDFREWLAVMGLTHQEAAARLGVSHHYVTLMASKPSTKHYRAPSARIRLACAEVSRRRLKEITSYCELFC